MDNVNNLNGISNFGHGEVVEPKIEKKWEEEIIAKEETKEKKSHKSKIKSEAQKRFGGRFN